MSSGGEEVYILDKTSRWVRIGEKTDGAWGVNYRIKGGLRSGEGGMKPRKSEKEREKRMEFCPKEQKGFLTCLNSIRRVYGSLGKKSNSTSIEPGERGKR